MKNYNMKIKKLYILTSNFSRNIKKERFWKLKFY